jgi:hypothetical protein
MGPPHVQVGHYPKRSGLGAPPAANLLVPPNTTFTYIWLVCWTTCMSDTHPSIHPSIQCPVFVHMSDTHTHTPLPFSLGRVEFHMWKQFFGDNFFFFGVTIRSLSLVVAPDILD